MKVEQLIRELLQFKGEEEIKINIDGAYRYYFEIFRDAAGGPTMGHNLVPEEAIPVDAWGAPAPVQNQNPRVVPAPPRVRAVIPEPRNRIMYNQFIPPGDIFRMHAEEALIEAHRDENNRDIF